MTDREKDLADILARLEEQRPEIDRILRRPAIIDTVGHFNPDGEEYLLNTVIRKLGYKFHEEA